MRIDAAQRERAIVQEHWLDSRTGLMWAGTDSQKDLSWKGAIRYCLKLRLSGFSDWRLASIAEMQEIYDEAAQSPGLSGQHSKETSTWHVRGKLFLTSYEWTRDFRTDDRGRNNGYVYYFDFNDGKANDDPTGWPYPHEFRRALCVRGISKPPLVVDQKSRLEDLPQSR